MHRTIRKYYRWVLAILLFLALAINYLDQQVIRLLKDWIGRDLIWTEKDYCLIVMAFTFAYAFGLSVFGRFIESIGTKLGYALSIIILSLAVMGYALARSPFGFGIARTAADLESGNFPSAIKAIAEWDAKTPDIRIGLQSCLNNFKNAQYHR